VYRYIPSENHLETLGILWQATFLEDWKLAEAKNFHMEFHLFALLTRNDKEL